MTYSAEPKQVLQRYLDALVAADIDTIRDSFAADATWTVKADLPITGPWHGRDQIVDLDDELKRRIAAAAILVPEGVIRGIVRLGDARRFEVAVTLICPEFSVTQAQEWVGGGEIPELARARTVECLDIDSGHWPMFTRPVELAGLLAQVADA